MCRARAGGSLAGLGREPSLERRRDLDGLLERPPKDMLASRGFRHVGVVVAPAEGRRVDGPDGVPGPAVLATGLPHRKGARP